MTSARVPSWIRTTLAIILLAVALHLVFSSITLAGYTMLLKQFRGTIIFSVFLLFGLWILGLWLASRLWRGWLAALPIVSILYAVWGFIRLSRTPSTYPNFAAFAAANRVALAGVLLVGAIAAFTWFLRRRRGDRSVVP